MPADFLIFPSNKSIKVSSKVLEEDIKSLFQRMRLWKD